MPLISEAASGALPNGSDVKTLSEVRGVQPFQARLEWLQKQLILQIAEKGPCVIVGRNSDYILKDRPDALHAYIHADMDFRADRIVRLYGESEKSPETRLNEKDKRRRVNYQHYTGRTWGVAQNYDICLDTSVVGIEEAANIIVSIVNQSK